MHGSQPMLEISLVVLREVAEAVLSGVFPDLRPSPIGEQADLQQRFAAGQTVLFEFLEIFPRRRLFAPQTGEPDFERFKRIHQRLDLAQLAALRRIFSIQEFPNSDSCCWTVLFGKHVDKVQSPFGCDSIPKMIGVGEVVAGLQKQHRDIGQAILRRR